MDIPLKPESKESINSDVNKLRGKMIMEEPSVNDMKTWLVERLDFYTTKTDRLGLFNEIMKLNTHKIITDVYYFHTIQPFFEHIQHLIIYERRRISEDEKRGLDDIESEGIGKDVPEDRQRDEVQPRTKERGDAEVPKDLQNLGGSEKKHLLNITTNANPDEILSFWMKLQGVNEKGEQYWESKQEIEHFVNQNFEGFPGVDEIREFNPNMNKSEMYQVTWTFFDRYGKYKTKRQYENLLKKNFTQLRNTKKVYSNIKDHSKDHLRRVTK